MFRKHLLIVAVLAITAAAASGSNVVDPFIVRRIEDIVQEDSRADEISYRLPNNTKPIHYDVWLETFVDQANFNFNGVVKILIQNRDSFPNITLHYRNLTINEVRLWTDAAQPQQVPLAVPSYTYDTENEFFVIHTAANLLVNNNYTIEVVYNATLRVDTGGFYRSSYRDNAGNVKWLATTQFESTDARHAYPCYDEPALKATYSIRIKHAASYTAISNMPTLTPNPVPNADGSVTTSFETTPKTSSYLIAFIVSDFKSLEKTSASGIVHRTFARSNAIDQTNLVLDAGEKILDEIGKYLSVNFSLPKMDQAAVPDFSAGAMENWGLVTYREQYFFYDEKVHDYDTKTSIVTVIAHEFGHQWFGNLVGPQWWTYLWLNEGFATLFEHIGTDLVYPDWKMMDFFVVDTLQSVFGSDSLETSRPMTHYVESPNAISSLYNNIAYKKSGSVLRMFLHAYSEKSFKKGLNYYLNARGFDDAAEEHLFAGLERAAKEDNTLSATSNATDIMYSWTRQAGYPVLHVERDYEAGALKLRQERYLQNPTTNTYNTKWWIPINIATAKHNDFLNTTAEFWLQPIDGFTVHDEGDNKRWSNDDWVVLNKQATGYYRIKYDEKNYELITEALRKNATAMHLTSRSQLLDDAAKFAQHKKQKWEIFLSLGRYLVREHEYVPWQSAINGLSYLDRAYSGHENYTLFTEYFRQIIEHLSEHVGVTDDANEPHINKYARTLAINWACKVGSEHCTKAANSAVKELIRTGQEFHQNVRVELYCAGLRTADESDYRSIWNRLVSSSDNAPRYPLFAALSCTRNETLLDLYLRSALKRTNSENIQYRSGDPYTIFIVVSQSGPIGVRHVIKFLTEYLLDVEEEISRYYLAVLIISISQSINSEADSLLYGNLTVKAFDNQIITPAQYTSINNTVKNNLIWTNENAAAITTWLIEHPDVDGASSLIVSALTIVSALFVSICRFYQ